MGESGTRGRTSYIIGLDYGSESARGVLIDVANGRQIAAHVHTYRHGVISNALQGGTPLAQRWVLQDATDYLEAAEDILTHLGRGLRIDAIGVDFTASSPMPATADGRPLSSLLPDDPHAYVKLWKHTAAQAYADEINRRGGAFLEHFGGKLSGEWLLAKAAQLAAEAPSIWSKADRFMEAGDWLVWRLTGHEARSLGFAAYKAQYSPEAGYPKDCVPGLLPKLSEPLTIGSPAGQLSDDWRRKTGITGPAMVAVSVIDSHAALPAVGAVSSGSFMGALGTSAAYLYLSDTYRPLPPGIEGVAKDGAVRGLWLYESGQASFGDTLLWFVETFPRAGDVAKTFSLYNAEAEALPAAASRIVGLDWWNGNRVPLADSRLSGLLLGLRRGTTAIHIYRALMESLCFGAKSVFDLFEAADFRIDRVIMTSGLAANNPLVVQIMADVFDRPIEVPEIVNSTAVGAAIHGAVASGLVADYQEGAARFGARTFRVFEPTRDAVAAYRPLYQVYRSLAGEERIWTAMRDIDALASA